MNDLLPKTIREMVGVIGLPATTAFVRAFGGKLIHIPKGHRAASAASLAEIVGEEEAMKLIRHYGDTTLAVPFCRGAVVAARNVEIVKAYDAGKSINELVDTYRITHRQLQNILKTTDTSLLPSPLAGEGAGERGNQRAFEF
ncbi:MAG: hypothetical protein FWC38_00490 [Proteobacteria bacterium]|nr:hypothetical protein [Pseudomonadota bacterium]MCL2306720.1 hypothetical protein [Pseudomonadota bacterium]